MMLLHQSDHKWVAVFDDDEQMREFMLSGIQTMGATGCQSPQA